MISIIKRIFNIRIIFYWLHKIDLKDLVRDLQKVRILKSFCFNSFEYIYLEISELKAKSDIKKYIKNYKKINNLSCKWKLYKF